MSLSIKSILGILLVSWLPFCERNNTKKLLVNKWQFASINEIKKASQLDPKDLEKNTKEEQEELDKMLQDIYSKSYYEFTKDKKYIINKTQSREKGSWEFAEDGKRLLLTDSKGGSTILYIKELTNAKLTLAIGSDSLGKAMTLIPFK
ncbi:hypothetical protein [Microscilla marina]|uniref:Lipocalin-like domain-containing protein n=1 Tax=Microscilla marina ATCC 23134 TaxID=313606 RepID=A1ZEA6_MICM2|nr:hypothetical protein [Microscilla marina]EAY31414.1 hypothetical protein M23134_04247 [Microscilla marina ATCC 23134]